MVRTSGTAGNHLLLECLLWINLFGRSNVDISSIYFFSLFRS